MTTLTREQWDAENTAIEKHRREVTNLMDSHAKTIKHLEKRRNALDDKREALGPRPDDAPSVERGGEQYPVTFRGGVYWLGASPVSCDSVRQIFQNFDIPDDNTLFALLALNPDGQVARLQRELSDIEAGNEVLTSICKDLQARVTELEGQAKLIANANAQLLAELDALKGEEPMTAAECIAAFEKAGYHRNFTHIEGEIWFAKHNDGGR